MKKVTIVITNRDFTGKKEQMILSCEVVKNDFDDHDTAGILFAIEHGANKMELLPIRVHINPE